MASYNGSHPADCPGTQKATARALRTRRVRTVAAARGREKVRIAALCAVAATTAVLAFPALVSAQQPGFKRPVAVQPVQSQLALREELNQNTVTVISGNPNAAYLYLAYDMSAVLDDGNNLRILPVIGKGGYQNMMDVLHL